MTYENRRAPTAVILAAGIGSHLGSLTDERPPSLLSVGGSLILERIIRNCLSCGVSQFVVVLGHRADQIKQFIDKTFRGIRVTYVINDRYRDTNTGYSLMLASSALGTSEFIKFDADMVFDVKILRNLIDDPRPDVLCVDQNIPVKDEKGRVVTDDQMQVLEIGGTVDPELVIRASIGIEKISAKTGSKLFAELAEMMKSPASHKDHHEAAYQILLAQGAAFHALDITGLNWTGIDTPADFATANAMFGSPVTTVSRGQQRAMDEGAAGRPITIA